MEVFCLVLYFFEIHSEIIALYSTLFIGRGRRIAGGFSDDESVGGDTASILSMNSDRGSFDDG